MTRIQNSSTRKTVVSVLRRNTTVIDYSADEKVSRQQNWERLDATRMTGEALPHEAWQTETGGLNQQEERHPLIVGDATLHIVRRRRVALDSHLRRHEIGVLRLYNKKTISFSR